MVNLPRSDSIGSGSGKFSVLTTKHFDCTFLQTLGRKYLAPTLSDPSARQEREKVQQTKKKNNIVRPNPPVNKNVIHLNDSEPNKSPREVSQFDFSFVVFV